ncbi:MAG TPA: hypothetical protein VK002_13345 [Rubricoccaceae bacterium]|nr:hypothetical protein [Rubricoccaceae bacterium]
MRPLVPFLALLALPACSAPRPGGDGDVACTLEFRTYTVQVVDEADQPVGGLTPTVRNLRTGEVLDLRDTGDVLAGGEGRYLVVTDAQLEQLSARGDSLHFRATGDGLVAEAEFVFSGGPCHVEKESGPEQIVARPEGD